MADLRASLEPAPSPPPRAVTDVAPPSRRRDHQSDMTTATSPHRSRAEKRVRRLLRVRDERPSATAAQAESLFSISIVISASRCLLTYVALPVLGPVLGSSVGDSPALGVALSVVALVFDVRSVRRFWMADHRWRWPMTFVYIVVAAMVVGLLVDDLVRLSG